MFNQLSDRLKTTFDRMRGRGLLSEQDVDMALREVRMALLEGDVALPVIKRFMALVRERAVGEQVLKSIKPGEQVVKIVHDALVEVLGEGAPLNLKNKPPVVVLMVGLQGSGKTTTTGKLAYMLKHQQKKKILLTSLDVYRPAAIQQLETLAQRVGVGFEPATPTEKPVNIAKRALKRAQTEGFDVLFLDSAGRLQIDADLMQELQEIQQATTPAEVMLVADSLTGQVAVDIAKTFHEKLGITGITLTRVDGDGRGGAALSMREITGQPIKFLGVGEGLEALEVFRPEGIAGRILQMGDIVSLVEKVQNAVAEDDAAAMQEKMMSGKGFDMNDLKKQLKMMLKMGGAGSLLGLMPGLAKFKNALDSSRMDNKVLVHQIAIIDSMTPAERQKPAMLNARRRQRIANGAGVSVQQVNKLVKSHKQMNDMMKKMQNMNPRQLAHMQKMLQG